MLPCTWKWYPRRHCLTPRQSHVRIQSKMAIVLVEFSMNISNRLSPRKDSSARIWVDTICFRNQLMIVALSWQSLFAAKTKKDHRAKSYYVLDGLKVFLRNNHFLFLVKFSRLGLFREEGRCLEGNRLSSLDKIVAKHLSRNTSDPSATSRMQGLFISYITLLRRNDLSWVVKEKPKVPVDHVLSAINPKSLWHRLSEELEFSPRALRYDFRACMEHAIKLAEAFELVDSGRGRKSIAVPERKSTTRFGIETGLVGNPPRLRSRWLKPASIIWQNVGW